MAHLEFAGLRHDTVDDPIIDRFVGEERDPAVQHDLVVEDRGTRSQRWRDRGRRRGTRSPATCRQALATRCFRLPAAALTMSLPTSVEPVKATLSTSGCSASAAPAVSPKPVTMLTTPSGKPASLNQFAETQRRERRLFGRLQHDRAAGGQRRRELPGRHHQREIPRYDLADDADRLAQCIDVPIAGARHLNRFAVEARRPSRHVPEHVDRTLHVVAGARCVTGLPLSSASSSANSSACCSRRSPSRQTRRERSPRQNARPRTSLEGPAGRGDRRVNIGFVAGWNVGDDLFGRRILDRKRLAASQRSTPRRSGARDPWRDTRRRQSRATVCGWRSSWGPPVFLEKASTDARRISLYLIQIAPRGARQEPNRRRLCVALTPHSQKTSPPPSGQHLWEDRVRCDKVEKPCVF